MSVSTVNVGRVVGFFLLNRVFPRGWCLSTLSQRHLSLQVLLLVELLWFVECTQCRGFAAIIRIQRGDEGVAAEVIH
jgi:hypothetical protein